MITSGDDTKPQSHIPACAQRTRAMQIHGNVDSSIINEGLQCTPNLYSFSWDFMSWETLLKHDIPDIHGGIACSGGKRKNTFGAELVTKKERVQRD